MSAPGSGGGTQLDRLYYTVDVDLGPAQSKFRMLDDEAGKAGGGIQNHMRRSTAEVEKFGRGVELSRRELLYFGREVATGDMRRIPSTLVLIGSHLAGLTTQSILLGGAIVAPFAAMATAAYQAGAAIDRVNRAIAASGNAAGVRPGQALDISKRLSAGGNISQRGALDIESILIGGGNVNQSNLSMGVNATNAYSKMTGMSFDKSADAISKMMADPAKAAKELHDNFNLLTDAQILQIEGLKSRTDQEAALFKALSDRGNDVEKSMWSLSKEFDSFTTFMSKLWFNTGTQISGFGNDPKSQHDQAMRVAQSLQVRFNHGAWGVSQSDVSGAWKHAGDLNWQLGVANRKADADAKKKAADQAAADARSPGALELRKYQNESIIAAQSPRDREMKRAQLEAEAHYQENLNNPDMVKYAGGIRGAQIKGAQTTQNSDRAQALTLVQQSADATERLAGAQLSGANAADIMNNANKAHAEFLKGTINDEGAYAAALDRSSQAERAIAAIKADRSTATEVNALRLELSLMDEDYDARQKQIAELKAHNQLLDEGWDLSTKAGKDELAQKLALVDAQQDLNKAYTDGNEAQDRMLSVAKEGSDVLGTVFDHAIQGGNAMKTLLPDIAHQIESTIVKLGITNPLQNALTKSLTPGAKQTPLPGIGDLGSLFAKMFGKGGAWSGGVRYAADGMVLGGATAFNTSGGPVVGGELGRNSEALMPLARGPGGTLGVRSFGGSRTGPVTVHQHINVHPDVSAVARGEIVKALPMIHTSAVQAVSAAIARGYVPGGASA